MSATVIVMPIIARPHPDEVGKRPLRIIVDRAMLSRLKARGSQWNMSPEETAAAILAEVLRPNHKGRLP